MSNKMIFAYAAGKINKEDGMYYMAAKERRNKELVGVFRYPFRWLAAHEGNAVIFDLITKAEYETYVAFGIEEITIPEIAKLGAIVDD